MKEVLYSDSGGIKIGVSKALRNELKRDAEGFEVFKGEEQTPTVNRLLNKLIYHYYEEYREEINEQARSFRDTLRPFIPDPDELEKAVSLLAETEEARDKQSGKNDGTPIKFLPAGEHKGYIQGILPELDRLNRPYADEFRRVLYRYSRKASYERERIVYRDVWETLERVCGKENTELRFIYRDDPARVRIVIPYKATYGSDGRYNYLLCQEYNRKEKRMTAVSYRLCRIVNPREYPTGQAIEPEVRKYLEKMEKYGPQYSINEDTITCVELTKEGRTSFRGIYQGRPDYDREDKPDERGNVKYYFSCSRTQLYLYFRRFNPGEARVLYPEQLNEELKEFHEKHLETMKE